ncbi:MAG: Crp/Fnr family transcriptional regulator, partial [Clostridiales bacterium]|nr:Crp/Fnr family transcriptional regulator [Clostridiales bacterium]
MEKILSPLFAGLSKDEYTDMRKCKCLQEHSFDKGELILAAGDQITHMGLILSGRVNIEINNLWGGRSILNKLGQGEIFGESYAITGDPLVVEAVAIDNSRILMIDIAGLFQGHHADASWHSKLLRKVLLLSAHKNVALSKRAFQLSSKKIRGRLDAYLSAQALETGQMKFDIPFNRQELADYLNVDRSALSKELT